MLRRVLLNLAVVTLVALSHAQQNTQDGVPYVDPNLIPLAPFRNNLSTSHLNSPTNLFPSFSKRGRRDQLSDGVPCHNNKMDATKLQTPWIYGDECTDARGDCWAYDPSICTEYADWAKDNCKKTCSFCSQTVAADTTSSDGDECTDAREDCWAYDPSICTDYADWASDNCKKTCSFCSQTVAADMTSSGGDECTDARGDCWAYDPSICTEYADWAKDNCKKTCSFCS